MSKGTKKFRMIEAWMRELQREHEELELSVIATLLLLLNDKRKRQEKKYWVSSIFKMRKQHGFFHAIFPVLKLDTEKFQNYLRLSLAQFETVLSLVYSHITKKYVVREPISAEERLVVTIRYKLFNFI